MSTVAGNSSRGGSRLSWVSAVRLTARTTCNVAVGIATIALLALAVGPHMFGYRTVVMRSGSMEPVISPGDVVVIESEPLSALAVGQILTFAAPVAGNPVYSHRVTAVRTSSGGTVVSTKGDANPVADPWQARISDARVWHVVHVVPGVGWVIAALHRRSVHVISVWLIPAALCAEVLLRLWRRPAPAQDSVPVGESAAA